MANCCTKLALQATLVQMQATKPPVAPRKLPDYLLSHGIHTVDLPEVQWLCDLDIQNARLAAARLIKDQFLFSPREDCTSLSRRNIERGV